jgi:threonine/homoserine/homoserine lactone efflux protein
MLQAVNPELFAGFVVAVVVLILMPGPIVTLVVANSLAHGQRIGFATVAGASSGNAVLVAAGALGLTTLLALAAELFEVLRWAGVAYLVFLGVQQWRAPAVEPGADERAVSGKALFAQGFLVTIANPKSLIFLAAFFPQFVDPAAPWLPQMVLLGVTFLVIGFVLTAAWGFAADRTRVWFGGRRLRLRNRIAGSLMIGAGVALAMVRRI